MASRITHPGPSAVVEALLSGVGESRVLTDRNPRERYARDQGPLTEPAEPTVVVLAEIVNEVQHVMR